MVESFDDTRICKVEYRSVRCSSNLKNKADLNGAPCRLLDEMKRQKQWVRCLEHQRAGDMR